MSDSPDPMEHTVTDISRLNHSFHFSSLPLKPPHEPDISSSVPTSRFPMVQGMSQSRESGSSSLVRSMDHEGISIVSSWFRDQARPSQRVTRASDITSFRRISGKFFLIILGKGYHLRCIKWLLISLCSFLHLKQFYFKNLTSEITPLMNIIFLRHGQTIEATQGIILGSLPWTLSDKWIQDIKRIWTTILKDYTFEYILSSDQKRAYDTAKILSSMFHVPIIQNSLLSERRAGCAEGKKENEIDWETYERKPFRYRKHPWWESYIEVKKRARQFIHSLSLQKDEDILIISHSAFIAMCISVLHALPIEEACRKMQQGNVVYIFTGKTSL